LFSNDFLAKAGVAIIKTRLIGFLVNQKTEKFENTVCTLPG
jgi:hypothetical protein